VLIGCIPQFSFPLRFPLRAARATCAWLLFIFLSPLTAHPVFAQSPNQTPSAERRAAAEQAYAEGLRLQAQRTAEARRQAIAKFQAALENWRAAGDQNGEARALFGLGESHLALGEKAAALDALDQSLRLWRALGARDGEAATLNTLGSAYLSIGESQQALDSYQAARALHRANGYQRGEAQTLSNLGLLYQSLGEWRQAADYYREAMALSRTLGERRQEAVALHNLGEVYLLMGEYRRALDVCLEALPLHQALDDQPGTAHTLKHLGAAHFYLGQPQPALSYYRQSLALCRAAGLRQMEAGVLDDLGAVYASQGEPERALEFYEQALALARAVVHRGGEASALAGAARVERERGNLRAARERIEAALAIIGALRGRIASQDLRASYFAARRDYHEFHIDLLMRLAEREPAAGHDAAALAASEQARARSLLDLLLAANVEMTTEAAPEPLPLAAIQSLLDPRAALLEYVLGRDRSFLFVVTRASLRSYRLPPKREIEPLVKELRAALASPSRREFGRYVSAARRLYNLLIAPAADVLRGQERLLIAPDGALYHLPFEALIGDGAGGGRRGYRDPRYLLNRWAISCTPSASVLAGLRARPARSADSSSDKIFLAFADPAYEADPAGAPMRTADLTERGKLRRLAESSREAGEIARLYRAEEVAIFTRQSATEEQVKNNEAVGRARRLHFATHARMDEQRPQASGLLLARNADSPEDGVLQIAEVFKLKLQAELVVLSACETGLGRTLSGEGVIGLTRAFMSAGARSVAVSLWQVADASTAELMVGFYRRLEREGDKAEALRRAKLELIEAGRYAHPYFWAPFVLSGEPK
jgi:CHAT domain-containing protein/Tfp pilus assembly protein PilF